MENQKIDWVRIVERKHTPLFVGFIVAGLKEELIKDATQIEHEFRNFKKIDLDLYFDRVEMRSLTSKIIEKTKQIGTKYLREHADRCYAQCEKLLETSRRIGVTDKFNSLSDYALADLFHEYSTQAERLGSYLTTVIACQNGLEPIFDENLRSLLEQHGYGNSFDKYKSALSIPSRENLFVENMQQLIAIGSEIQRSDQLMSLFHLPEVEIVRELPKVAPTIWSDIQSYISKFGWMGPQYYRGEAYSPIDVVLRLKNILLEDCNKKRKQMEDERRQREARFKQVMERLDSSDFFDLVKTVRDYLHLRTYRLEVFFIANEYVRKLLEEIASRLDLTYDDIIFFTHNEIADLLKRSEKANKSLSQVRKRGFAIIMIDGNVSIYEGHIYEKLLEKEARVITGRIEGVVASRGKAEGCARIVLVTDDIYKVNKGDIIVATMTTPNFIPAIEKCSAIVTDEGGILCHAAIVSREFAIPCVIGTADATKKINDGDLIQVDATGKVGIITVLKRNDI